MADQMGLFDYLEDPTIESAAEEVVAPKKKKKKQKTEKPDLDPSWVPEARVHDNDLTETELGTGGKKERFQRNLLAIKILKEIEEDKCDLSKKERNLCLSQYVGWGGLQEAFYRPDGSTVKGWAKECKELKEILTKKEYEAALQSILNAHYTSKPIINSMWQAVNQMGFDGGKVLEPSVGTGNFLGLMALDKYNKSQINAIELDSITSRIAKVLYPMANIYSQGFEQSNDFDPEMGTYDLVIGNPPFGQEKVNDPLHPDISNRSIHNYFALKSVKSLRENGVLAMVISRYFLDSKNSKTRERIAKDCQFLGAVRLPNTAFERTAGTSVTTDIVFFRKYEEAESEEIRNSPENLAWTKTDLIENSNDESQESYLEINQHYIDNKNMILGQFGDYGGTAHGAESVVIEHEGGQDTETLVNEALKRLPKNIMPLPEKVAIVGEKLPHFVRGLKVGSIFEYNNEIFIRMRNLEGKPRAKRLPTNSTEETNKLKAFLKLSNCLEILIENELGIWGDYPHTNMGQINKEWLYENFYENDQIKDIEFIRGKLNKYYDDFVERYGFINSPSNRRLFKIAPDWSKISGLEKYTPKISKAQAERKGIKPQNEEGEKIAAIFSKRVLFPENHITEANSAEDAITASLNKYGQVDMGYVEEIYRKSEEEIIEELGDKIYKLSDRNYQMEDQFLSGNVKNKLKDAIEMADENPEYERNVIALEKVIPEDIPIHQIKIKMGAHWIPEKHMSEFITDIYENKATATYEEISGKWLVYGTPTYNSDEKWGTDRATTKTIIRSILSQKTITIKDKDLDGNETVNHVETVKANQKRDTIMNEFQSWVMVDKERADELERIYNDRFNTNVQRKFDGAHLTFPGKVDDSIIKLQDHQRDAVWRSVSCGGNTLLHHPVGAGKTYTIIATAMEMKRLGIAKKPMIVVPNHIVEQWAQSFHDLYPNAKLLVPTKEDYTKDNRERLFSRIALDEWDAIIVAHSSFDNIKVSIEREIDMIKGRTNEILEGVKRIEEKNDDYQSRRTSSLSLKQLRRMSASLEAKQKKLAGQEHDGYTFDQLGVDSLFIDEAHAYKNLFYATSLERIAGLNPPMGSSKAFNLHLKKQFIEETTGNKGIIFASGTPISNSLIESYTMNRYLNIDEMTERGLHHFDAWVAMCAEITTEYEVTATQTYNKVTRIGKYQNLPEVVGNYLEFADVVTREEIQKIREKNNLPKQIPNIKGGKPQIVLAERSEEQAEAIGQLVIRADTMTLPDNMLAIITDAKKVALDMRIVNKNHEDHEGSKINLAVEKITDIYNKTNDKKGTQIVFIDLSTPKKKLSKEYQNILELEQEAKTNKAAKNELSERYTLQDIKNAKASNDFSCYDDIKYKLRTKGIPPDEIEFIHDAETDQQKRVLFGKVNDGKVRIILGSTQKLGAGTNIQNKLVAMHHLDCPWRPSDVEQREGRILRPGNEFFAEDPNFEVEIYRYATKQTLDAKLWQTIEVKANFIEQLQDGIAGKRESSEMFSEAQLAATIKAEATGDPFILKVIEVKEEIRKLELEKTVAAQSKSENEWKTLKTERNIKKLPEEIASMEEHFERGKKLGGDQFRIKIGEKASGYNRGSDYTEYDNRIKAGNHLKKLLEKRHDEYVFNLGEYAGLELILNKVGKVHRIDLRDDKMTYPIKILTEDTELNPKGLMQSIHANLSIGLQNKINSAKRELESDKKILETLKIKSKESWDKEGELEKAKDKIVRLEKIIQKRKDRVVKKYREQEKGENKANKRKVEMEVA